jgi:HK97 family phage prohead protease
MGEYTEAFEPGAFRKTIMERDDIVLLANHEGLPFARYPGTLSLAEDDIGLFSSTELNHLDPDVTSLVSKMPGGPGNRNDLNQMSIAFRAVRQEWDTSGDLEHRRIIEAKLYDVSVVTSPANPYTDAGLRSADDLLRELMGIAPEEFAAQVRSAHAEGLGVELLERLESLRSDERDMESTMSFDIARRRLELASL